MRELGVIEGTHKGKEWQNVNKVFMYEMLKNIKTSKKQRKIFSNMQTLIT